MPLPLPASPKKTESSSVHSGMPPKQGGILSQYLYHFGFFIQILRGVPSFLMYGKASRRVCVTQIFFTFVEALGIVVFLAAGIGTAIIVIGMPFFAGFSQERLIYPMLITIILREAGPLLVAFIIIARSATAIATELATNVISHEAEAYISVGIDPVEHLAAPRFLAVIFSSVCLNIYFALAGLAGSFWVSQLFFPLPAAIYFGNLIALITLLDIVVSVFKSFIFGTLIAIIAISFGFAVERSSTEIPIAGLRAVSTSFIWCIAFDGLISLLFYTLR